MAMARTKQRSRTSRQISRTARGRNREQTLVSQEPYGVAYLHKRFPNATHRQVSQALNQCQEELKTDDRQQIMTCVKEKLGEPRG